MGMNHGCDDSGGVDGAIGVQYVESAIELGLIYPRIHTSTPEETTGRRGSAGFVRTGWWAAQYGRVLGHEIIDAGRKK